MASVVTSDPSVLSHYCTPASFSKRVAKAEDLCDLRSAAATASAAEEDPLPPFITTCFLTNAKLPLRPHKSPLSAACRYNFIPELRSTLREYKVEDVTYTVLGPAHLMRRLSERASAIFHTFLVHDCPHVTISNRPFQDVICKVGREVVVREGETIPGETLDIATETHNELIYQKPVGLGGIPEKDYWLIVVITRGKDELLTMPINEDFGIGCRSVAETVHNVCNFLRSFSPPLQLSRRTLVHAIEDIYFHRSEIALHLREGDTYLLRHTQKNCFTTTVGILKNSVDGSYPWRAFVILSRKEKGYPLLGKGGDSVVTFAVEISSSPQVLASLACYGDYDCTLRAIRLHQEFAYLGAVKIEAHFPPYDKEVIDEGRRNKKTVARVLEELYQKNLMTRVEEYCTTTSSLLPLQKVLEYTHFILRFLKTFHAKGWAHRDIKAQNILFSSKESTEKLAITDFMRACSISDESLLSELYTTPNHIDPSLANAFCLANGSRHSYHYTFVDFQAADIWAVGITMMHLMLNSKGIILTIAEKEWTAYKAAHSKLNPDLEIQNEIRDAYAITFNCTDSKWATRLLRSFGYACPPVVERLIEGMLDPDPRTRLTASAAEAALVAILNPSMSTIQAKTVSEAPAISPSFAAEAASLLAASAGAGGRHMAESVVVTMPYATDESGKRDNSSLTSTVPVGERHRVEASAFERSFGDRALAQSRLGKTLEGLINPLALLRSFSLVPSGTERAALLLREGPGSSHTVQAAVEVVSGTVVGLGGFLG